jgi:hypothetical protein
MEKQMHKWLFKKQREFNLYYTWRKYIKIPVERQQIDTGLKRYQVEVIQL